MPDKKVMIKSFIPPRFTAFTPVVADVQPATFAGGAPKFAITEPAKPVVVNPIPSASFVVPLRKQSPAVRIEDVRLTNPVLADLISKVRVPITGMSRDKVSVPISPLADVSDQILYEDPADASKKFYLARYRLVVQNQQYQISMKQSGQEWTLTLHLERYPAPEIEAAARGAEEIDHAISVILTHNLMVGGSSAGEKELVFQEVVAEGSGVKAVLHVGTLPERDRLYQAMTDPAYGARLVVRRAVRVAIPVTASLPPPVTRVPLDRPAMMRLAVEQPPGRVFHPIPFPRPPLPPVPPGPGSTLPLFREVTRTLDNAVDPVPFVFPPSLNGYIFGGITPGSGQSFRLIRRTIESNSYYQDPAQPYLFYYLPDSFKIARIPQSPHLPFMMVRFVAPEGDPSPERLQATLNYASIPFVDPDRLEADSDKLKQRYLTGSLPAGVDGPVFEPLLVDAKGIRFLLSLPRTDPSSGPYQERKGASVDLRSGIHDILTLAIKDFQTIFEAMFSPVALLFDGRIEMDIGDGPDKPSEAVPFVARMNDLVGDLFDYKEISDEASGGVRVTFKNAIESPLQIKSLRAELQRGEKKVPARIEGVSFDPPIQLRPNEELQFVVAPTALIEGSDPLHALFDLDGVAVLPDKEAIWNVILDPSTSDYLRIIHVQTFKEIFDPPQDKPQAQILEIDVELKRGSEQIVTAKLTAGELKADLKLPVPISDYILEREDQGQYSYRVTVIRREQAKEGHWKAASRDTLWITSSEVS
jgi:hypothetical protein